MNTYLKLLSLTVVALLQSACGGNDAAPRAAVGSAIPTTVTTTTTTTTTTMSTTATVTVTPVAAADLKAMIKALEDSGQLPKLDRSSDIKGPDANNNGIRDDIDAWIAALPVTAAQKKAAQQSARVQQATVVTDLNDKPALRVVSDRMSASVKCLRVSFMPDYQKGYDLGSQIEAITANTKERAMQYIKFNRAMSGTTSSSISGNTCEP